MNKKAIIVIAAVLLVLLLISCENVYGMLPMPGDTGDCIFK